MDSSTPHGNRVASIDAFRGFTIALMILVNNPGSGDFVLPPLRHAAWHGWTLTDLVFPFFLFIMGAAMAFSLPGEMVGTAVKRQQYLRAAKRSLALFGLGFFANLLPGLDFSTVRIFGVLQRIGVVYFFSFLIIINFRRPGRTACMAVLFLVYWGIMVLVPFPGMGADPWARGANMAQYFDTLVLGRHAWVPGLEPEGIISTLPSIVTSMAGFFAGELIAGKRSGLDKNLLLFVAANALVLAALALEPVMPVNKQLWTGTYALISAGLALNFFGVFYWLMDIRGFRRGFNWFMIFGSNSIAIYCSSIIIAKAVRLITVTREGTGRIPLKTYIFNNYLIDLFGAGAGSLAYPVAMILLLYGGAYVLHKKKVYIRV